MDVEATQYIKFNSLKKTTPELIHNIRAVTKLIEVVAKIHLLVDSKRRTTKIIKNFKIYFKFLISRLNQSKHGQEHFFIYSDT